MKPKTIPAAKFKAECLALLDEVAKGHGEIVVTKRGKPVARLVALAPPRKKPTVKILGDIVNFSEPEWLK